VRKIGKTLKVAVTVVSAASLILFSCITIGVALETGPGALFQRLAPKSPRPVFTAPIAIDLSGYSLDPAKRDHMVFVTVAMTAADMQEEAILCQNMPRLRTAVIQKLAGKLRSERENQGVAAPSIVEYTRDLAAQAFNVEIVGEFGLLVDKDWRRAPTPTCPEVPGEEF
jgi:hypothetical protein